MIKLNQISFGDACKYVIFAHERGGIRVVSYEGNGKIESLIGVKLDKKAIEELSDYLKSVEAML